MLFLYGKTSDGQNISDKIIFIGRYMFTNSYARSYPVNIFFRPIFLRTGQK